MQLRDVTVNHLLENSTRFQCLLREEYTTVQDYVSRTVMLNSSTWATEVEIMAMAELLDVSIYIHTMRSVIGIKSLVHCHWVMNCQIKAFICITGDKFIMM